MPLVALVCAGLLGMADGPAPVPAPDVAAEYQAAQVAARRTPGDQIRLALWCEARGLTAERMRHLALALLADPANATARGLSGLVARDGRWVAPDAVARAARDDEATKALLAEYDLRRSKAAYTADAQWSLAQWADEQGLKEQARAHYTAVTRLDPTRELAWKRLGYKKQDGRWATDAQLAAARSEADAQKQADRAWKPLLEKWRGMLAQPSRRDEAHAALLGVTDPRALPSIARVFGTDRPMDQQVAVGLLGQIESPQASRSLAALAVLSPTPDVRRAALETVRRRDPRDFLGYWIASIRAPIKYEVKAVGGPGSPGTLFIGGEKANTRRVYRPMDAPDPTNYAGAKLTYDANGLPVLVEDSTGRSRDLNGPEAMWVARQSGLGFSGSGPQLPDLSRVGNAGELASKLEAASRTSSTDGNRVNFLDPNNSGARSMFADNRTWNATVQSHVEVPIGQMMIEAQSSAQIAGKQLSADVAKLDAYNASVHRANDPVILALREVSGQDLGEDEAKWSRWWTNEQGYAVLDSPTRQTPTFVENVPIGYTSTATPVVTQQVVGVQMRAEPPHSCFGAGTPVRTVAGTKAIESIRRGDLVLVEDTLSGALSYQPVLTAFHNPPNSTYRIKLGDDEVVATGIHRFWKAGHGWTMARDLKAGDSLRVLGGVATVEGVTHEATQPVFNLEVAEGRSFFVGRVGALVHDNSLVEATPSPFDAAHAVGPVAAAAGPVAPR